PVAGVLGFVAQNEFACEQESVLDRPKRSADPRVFGGKKADQWDQQQAGIELLRSVGLDKAVKVAVETVFTDLGVDFVGDLAPALPWVAECLSFQLVRRAIERDPSHDLRMNKVLLAAAHFPNAVVRLPPRRRQIVQYNGPESLAAFGWRHTCFQRLKHRVGDLAKHIELQLPGCVIADPRRS